MIITISKVASKEEMDKLFKFLEDKNLKIFNASGESYRLYGVIGDTSSLDIELVRSFKCVENVQRIASPYKKACRQFHPEDTVVEIKGIKIGGNNPLLIIGGPCAVENKDGLMLIANGVKAAGARGLRGGAYKPRTSPYSFQGLQTEGIHYLAEASKATGLITVSEILSSDKIQEFVDNIDIIQVGARNMQNFELLKELGKIDKPILLKRGLSNTIEEWLMSAEYIMAGGNNKVILCERGIRTFERYTRNTLDLSVIPLVKKLSHLPVIIDPSHATGRWDLVETVSLAAIAAGADGLIIEVHNNPEQALSDGAQSLTIQNFEKLIEKGKKIAQVVERDI